MNAEWSRVESVMLEIAFIRRTNERLLLWRWSRPTTKFQECFFCETVECMSTHKKRITEFRKIWWNNKYVEFILRSESTQARETWWLFIPFQLLYYTTHIKIKSRHSMLREMLLMKRQDTILQHNYCPPIHTPSHWDYFGMEVRSILLCPPPPPRTTHHHDQRRIKNCTTHYRQVNMRRRHYTRVKGMRCWLMHLDHHHPLPPSFGYNDNDNDSGNDGDNDNDNDNNNNNNYSQATIIVVHGLPEVPELTQTRQTYLLAKIVS